MKEYFAYGSNLNLGQMAGRCPESTTVQIARLEGYELAFRGGVLTILPKEDSHVEGLIWSISEQDERHLDRYEGFPRLYGKENVTVQDASGTGHAVLIYIMEEPWCSRSQEPGGNYLNTVLEGCRQIGVYYYIVITKDNDGAVIWLDNTDYNADIDFEYTGGTKLLTSGGVETTVTIYMASDEPAAEIQYQDAGRVYDTDNSRTAANEDSYTMTPKEGVMQNDRSLGEISLSKVDLDAVRYVGGRDTDGDAMASGQAHADAQLDGAVYDLYAAEDIQHPDGVTGTVDYSKITYADGTPIWHTTIRDNSGQWVDDYLPVLAKDHLVASAVIKDGWLTFSNLYLGKYYIVERGTGVVIPVEDGAYRLSGTYPDVDSKIKEPTGTISQLATNDQRQYTDYVYKNQWSYIGQSKALDGTKTYDGYYESYATGYLCDEHNYTATGSD